MIAIIDYQMGNVGSIVNMLKRVGASAVITADPEQIIAADKLILPGVGAFDKGMSRLRSSGLIPVLNEKVLVQKTPILGICLGMQLLGTSSEEGSETGLGWINARNVRFRFDGKNANLKIPHMGWNSVRPVQRETLFHDLEEDHGFYFVHSYHLVCERNEDVLAWAHYGYDFPAAVESDNIAGTQFHPEKSHKHGMRVLRSFALTGAAC